MLTAEMLLGDALDYLSSTAASDCRWFRVTGVRYCSGKVSRHDVMLALQDRMTEKRETRPAS